MCVLSWCMLKRTRNVMSYIYMVYICYFVFQIVQLVAVHDKNS